MTTYAWRGVNRLDDADESTCYGVRGTVAGYGRHKRNGEKPCSKCRDAMNTYNRKRRRKWEGNPDTKAKDRDRRKAKARAWAELARRHNVEFQALMRVELGRVITEGAGQHSPPGQTGADQ